MRKISFLLLIMAFSLVGFAQDDSCICAELKSISIQEYRISVDISNCIDTVLERDRHNKIRVIAYDCGDFFEVEYYYRDGSLKSRVLYITDTVLNTDTINYLDPDDPDIILSTEVISYYGSMKHGQAVYFNVKGKMVRKEIYSYDKKIACYSTAVEETLEF